MKFSDLKQYSYFAFKEFPTVICQKLSIDSYIEVNFNRQWRSDACVNSDIIEFLPKVTDKVITLEKKKPTVSDMKVGQKFSTSRGKFIRVRFDDRLLLFDLTTGLQANYVFGEEVLTIHKDVV